MKYTAIVLAAQRQGAIDPLFAHTRGGHKCLLDIAGRPMISWVLSALLNSPSIRQVVVSADDTAILDELNGFEQERRSGRLTLENSESNLYASVVKSMGGERAPRCPVLITTADNPLLTPEMLAYFVANIGAQSDVAVAMTAAKVMQEKYPDGQRRFYQFSDGNYSNCNLYAITSASAVNSAKIFAHGGQFGKKALRMLRAFGLLNFLLYRFGYLSLNTCGKRLSRGFNAQVQFVEMPFAEAPIDVDNERTLRIAREIMLTRLSAQQRETSIVTG